MSVLETLLEDRYQDKSEPKMPGVLTAKVTGRMGDMFELSYLGMGQGAPSAPARVMAPMAGAKRGAWMMPEVGDEVVVAFDSGDSNMPIILGALWNGPSPAPEQAKPSPENNIRTIVSRSGHEVTFDDTSAQEQLKVRSKGGHEIVLDDTPPGKISIKSPTGAIIEFDDATQTLRISSPLVISLETGALNLLAGGINMGPPPPSSGISAPPAPTVIRAPLALQLESTLISLKAASIELVTTGNAATSLVTIDGKPFGLHTHGVPPQPVTGTVTP